VYSLPAVSWALFDLASTTFSMNVMGRLIWQHRQLRWFMLAMLLYLDVHDTATIYMSAYANFAMAVSGC
jgi:MFS-type transporter involved in bile tolerance (Atg22 family)